MPTTSLGIYKLSRNIAKMDLEKQVEDPPCCRVCHEESAPDSTLYFPCKCSGTIKYVHQECLIEWLKISKNTNDRCEICGENFSFKNEASTLTTWLRMFYVELLRIPRAILSIVFYICALFIFPIFTHWLFELLWCGIAQFNPNESVVCIEMKSNLIPTYCVCGLLELVVIMHILLAAEVIILISQTQSYTKIIDLLLFIFCLI